MAYELADSKRLILKLTLSVACTDVVVKSAIDVLRVINLFFIAVHSCPLNSPHEVIHFRFHFVECLGSSQESRLE